MVPAPTRTPLLFVLLAALAIPPTAASASSPGGDAAQAGAQAEIRTSTRNDLSAPLRQIPPIEPRPGSRIRVLPLHPTSVAPGERAASDGTGGSPADQAAASAAGPAPAPDTSFEGVPNVDGVLPPDTNGDIGPDHYVQMVNLSFAIFTRSGDVVYGPARNNTIWTGFGGPCEQTNDGDPIVLYDHLAGRWLLSQFALPNGFEGPFYECIAISQTDDPTGAYFRYEFKYSDRIFNDYPKLGVWPDAYYASMNEFTPDDEGDLVFTGAGVVAYEREAMLLGLPARQVIFHQVGGDPRYRSLLPSDLDGPPPPAGTPNYFAMVSDASQLPPVDALRIWEFHVDWSNPEASSFGIGGQPNQVLPTAPFNLMLCRTVRPPTRNCVPQPAGPPVDELGDRLMFRLQYRNLGDHASLATNHTVDADVNHAAVRWYQLRQDPGEAWAIEQQGTHSPNLHEHRWMGSVARDNDGNLAAGYSVSGLVTFPSIRYAGRLASDPPNTLPQTETTLIAGSGSQLFPIARWGDYSMMAVDPADDCTFWYTQQYIRDTDLADWRTRVGAFAFPSCTPAPVGTLTGRVREAGTGAPIEDAVVTAGAYSALTDHRGLYEIQFLPAGVYDVEASAFGYQDLVAPRVRVQAGRTVVRNFALSRSPTSSVVTGQVRDASGHGYPLYTQLDIVGRPGGPVFTHPVTGRYRVILEQGAYEFRVVDAAKTYEPLNQVIAVPAGGTLVQDFGLTIDPVACLTPGYEPVGIGIFEEFNTGELPEGWTVKDNAGLGQVWRFDDPGDRGNLTGGEGLFAIVDSDEYGTVGLQDTELISPVIDLSDTTSVTLQFDTDFRYWDGSLNEVADSDVSVDGGETWVNVWRRTGGSYRGPAHEVVDISELAAGQPDVRVRFHYYDASFEYWWQVDNAKVGQFDCQPTPGGLVVGNVRDAESRAGIDLGTVTSLQAPEDSTTTFSTEDPKFGEGFYVLFSSLTGSHPFEAAADGYASQTRRVDVKLDGVVLRNFSLSKAA